MKGLYSILISCLILINTIGLKANNPRELAVNDSLTLAQAYINLSLTKDYFDSLPSERISIILPFEEGELVSVTDSNFIQANNTLYNTTYAFLYFNKAKLLYRNRNKINREILMLWKNTLDTSIQYFNRASLNNYVFDVSDPAITLKDMEKYSGYLSFNYSIGFSDVQCRTLMDDILSLKHRFNPYFNENIYLDFKRIFHDKNKSNSFHFDSLSYYAGMFNLPLDSGIMNSTKKVLQYPRQFTIKHNYDIELRLTLISRYIQFNYLAGGETETKFTIDNPSELFDLYDRFSADLDLFYDSGQADSFFLKEINFQTILKLYLKLRSMYNYPDRIPQNPTSMKYPKDILDEPIKYYFPIPAPFPSGSIYINNYQPALATMKQVDDHFKNIFYKKGYEGQLHYYYLESGYAFTTSLEKISNDGSPVSGSERWSVSAGGNGSFSLYETFKSIFFATESNFRIIGLIVSPGVATVHISSATIGAMHDLITHSYPSLPIDLESLSLPQKTLTVLIYNFYQSDIGKVPMIDLTKRLTARNHLEKSGLEELLNNR